MANILLGCDHHSTSYDKESQKVIAEILEKAGHTVEILNVGPNYTQSAMKNSSSKGKIGVFLVNGADLQTYKDVAMGIKQGYYHVDFGYFGLQGYINKKTCTCDKAKTVQLKKAHDDASSVSYTKELIGMTTAEVCQKYSSYIAYACGSSREELGNNLVSVISGGSVNNQPQNEDSGDDEEEWDDKDNFTPHKGKIMEIRPYKEISSISFDKSYDSPTGTGSVELLYKSKDYRYLYKGVAMKLKLRRTSDAQWSATGLEEPNYDENEKFFKEHIPTNELLKELGLPNYRKRGILKSSVDTYGSDDSSGSSETTNNTSSSSSNSQSSSSSTSRNKSIDSSKNIPSSSKKSLTKKEVNSLSPTEAKKLSKQTNKYNTTTIKALRRRALGLYW